MADIIRSIEPFELTQVFGVNPESYKRFGLAGHNGWDFRTKFPDTPLGKRNIMASWLMQFYRQGNEGNDGYGRFFETVCRLKSIWKLTFAHCDSIENFVEKKEGETMAISDNTGNSTGAHLHVTVKRIKIVNGVHEVQNYNNGFFGAINPQEFFDELRAYKKAGKPPQEGGDLIMQVDNVLYEKLVTNSTERDAIRAYLGVSLDPQDGEGKKVKESIDGLRNLATGLQRQLSETQQEVKNREEQVERIKQTYDASAKTQAERITALEIGQKSFDKERESLKNQIDDFAKAKGELAIELERTKTLLVQEQGKSCSTLTLGDVILLFWNKIRNFQLK